VGEAGGGIRVDGFNNTVFIDNNTKVYANGDGGTGLLVAFGTGHHIIHRGDIQANGKGIPDYGPVMGVRFDFGPPMFEDYDTAHSYGYDRSVYGDGINMTRVELDGPLAAQFSNPGLVNFNSTSKYTVRGNDSGRDCAIIGTGLNYERNNWRLFSGYDAYVNDRQVLHTGNAGLAYGW
jgi:hypothetical protein